MRYRAFLMLMIVTLLAACTPAGGTVPTPAPTAKPTASAVAQATPAASPTTRPTAVVTSPADPVIVYERSGGIAGVREKWTVYPDGRVVTQAGRERRLAPEAVEALVAELERAGVFRLDNEYGVGGSCRDCFTATLTVRRDDMLKQVTAVLEDQATPAEVRGMFGRVEAVVRE